MILRWSHLYHEKGDTMYGRVPDGWESYGDRTNNRYAIIVAKGFGYYLVVNGGPRRSFLRLEGAMKAAGRIERGGA